MRDCPIAIVGMSCRFAGCATPGALWNAVMARRNMLSVHGKETEIPFGQKNIFSAPYPTRLGQLGSLYSCVPAMQNFPRQVNAGENQDLYFATQLAFDALADASIRAHSRDAINGSIHLAYAPPFNASTINWLQHTAFLDQTMEILHQFMPKAPADAIAKVRIALQESLPEPNASSFLMGSGYRLVSWIARECSFSGEAAMADGGILSGAVAIQSAMDQLRDHRADVALAGAVAPPLSRAYLEGLSGDVAFSTRTELQPFAQDADGTIPGEGGAFFVLKRRDDALRDRDRIYALIRDVAIGATRDEDAGDILRLAMERSGVAKESIGLIEADGSGVATMDAREVDAIQKVWGEHTPGGSLVGVGSIKGNIGHTLHASVAASIVKTALALRARVLPPQIIPDHPLDALSRHTSSAYLLTDALPWITADSTKSRCAAVLSSNFDHRDIRDNLIHGGRNAAIILEEEPEDRA